jgi:hypothetical protein
LGGGCCFKLYSNKVGIFGRSDEGIVPGDGTPPELFALRGCIDEVKRHLSAVDHCVTFSIDQSCLSPEIDQMGVWNTLSIVTSLAYSRL